MLERDNHKQPGARRWIKAIVVATTAVAVASSAVVGTVAAQTGQMFNDVPRGHYAYDSVQWAVEHGITQGCGDGRDFCPQEPLNRAQAVTLLKRYHDRFGRDASDASVDAGDGRDPEEHTIRERGTAERSINLSAGRYSVHFTVEHSADLATLALVVEDFAGRRQTLFAKSDFNDDEQSFRGRSSIVIGPRLGELEPGRVYFDVTVTDDDARGFLADWEIVITER